MQLRSGSVTKKVDEKSSRKRASVRNEEKVSNDESPYWRYKTPRNEKEYCKMLKDALKDCEENPVCVSFKNLRFTLWMYEFMDYYLPVYYDLLNLNSKKEKLLLVTYKKTITLMSDLVRKTYEPGSTSYDAYDKELLVRLLYTLRKTFIWSRSKLQDVEKKSPVMQEYLREVKNREGERIKEKNTNAALTYYCYRHLYNSIEENEYEIQTYEDGNYTYEEIYDYYFGENIKKESDDDLLIKKDYEIWFEDEENTERYESLHIYRKVCGYV